MNSNQALQEVAAMVNPEIHKPQETPDTLSEEGVRGVMLDPDGIRALLAKIQEKAAQE